MQSLFRVLKFAFQDIGRNIGLSIMTIFILILMLISINMVWAVKILTNESVNLLKEQINININLKSDVTEKDVSDIKAYIQTIPEVESMQLLSREQVLEQFKNRYRTSREILDALNELDGNPFGPTLVIRTTEPDNYRELKLALAPSEYAQLIESNSYEKDENALTNLQIITNRVENIGLGLLFAFALIAFLIIFNTIRVSIYTHKVEISIKRLVGAQNWFIRGPYIIEAFFFSFLSIVCAAVILYFIFTSIDPYLSKGFYNGFSLTNYYKSNILYLTSVQFLAILILTTLSSSLAMRKHLKV